MVLLVLALAGLSLVRPTRELFVVFAVDRSESIGEEGNEAIDAFLSKAAHAGRLQPVRGASVCRRAGQRAERRRRPESDRRPQVKPVPKKDALAGNPAARA